MIDRRAGAKADEKLEVTRANAASYSLGMLELADVAPKGTALEQPVTIESDASNRATGEVRIEPTERLRPPIDDCHRVAGGSQSGR